MRLAMSKEYNTEQEKPEVSETDTETAESEA
jgi:hypothetical protein